MTEYREGQTATNHKTGQKVVYRGGQWVNAGGGGQGMGGGAPAGGLQITGQGRNDTLNKLNALKLLREQMLRSAHEFDRSQNGSGPLKSLGEMMPGLVNGDNARYDATVSAMTPLAKAAFRVPGSGSDSDKESSAFMALLPSRGSNDAGNIERYRQMADILKQSITQQRRGLGLYGQRAQAAKAAAPKAPAASHEIDFNSLPE